MAGKRLHSTLIHNTNRIELAEQRLQDLKRKAFEKENSQPYKRFKYTSAEVPDSPKAIPVESFLAYCDLSLIHI